ncbi:MAG: helix-turn-helix domain-containing protein [Thermodesulfobacteriota bacterium]|nr:helix-turn-helix domain-containing protein [Thermodesulfobacteriota bacterium]
MTPEEIKIEIFKRRRHVSCATIGRDVGVSRQSVHQVIERKFVSIRIMDAIASAIGKHRLEVFPETVNTKPRPTPIKSAA